MTASVPDGMTAESLRWVARYVPHGTPPSRLIRQWIAELEAAEQAPVEVGQLRMEMEA